MSVSVILNHRFKAYRIEPLIYKNYEHKSPIEIQKASDFYKNVSYIDLNKNRPLIQNKSGNFIYNSI